MKYEQLELFKLVVEHGSITSVANKLNVTSAAVGKQLTLLEKRLSIQLLIRTTRNISLTEIGKVVYEQACDLVRQMEGIEQYTASSKEEPKGELKIRSSIHFGEKFLIPHLSQFNLKYPKIKFELELLEQIPTFSSDKVDILFGVLSTLDIQDLVRRKLITTSYKLCATPAYIKKMGMPITPHNLTNHNFITHSNRPDNNLLTFKNIQISLTPSLQVNDTRSLLACTLEGLGFSNLLDFIVDDLLKHDQLIEILPDYSSEEKYEICLYYKKTRYTKPEIKAFIEFINKRGLFLTNSNVIA